MDAKRAQKYVNLGSFRSNGSLYLADPTILPSSKSLTQSVLLDAGIPVGLFPITVQRAKSVSSSSSSISSTEQILYQSGEILRQLLRALPLQGVAMPIFRKHQTKTKEKQT
jgi:hypothetical protein